MCATTACNHHRFAEMPDSDLALWYEQPAAQWEETLPLGNGRLGMMPDGGIGHEKIVLNEISMWSGSEADYGNPQAAKSLPQIQQLLYAGRNKEAQALMYSSFVPAKPEKGGTYGAFQMLGDLDIDYDVDAEQATNYRRWLDIENAISYTQYEIDGVRFERSYSVPREQDAMLVHVVADKPGAVNLSYTISRPERAEVSTISDMLLMVGALDSGKEGVDGLRFAAAAISVATGRNARVATSDNRVTISQADEAWIVITANTDYFAADDYQALTLAQIAEMQASDLRQVQAQGANEHARLMNRARICLPATENSSLPTDKRILAFQDGDDPQLAALYYNYGRYLLISSTHPGYLPPNLQGLWANECGTPWNGDYHTNINVQMNHWPAEQGNLSELHLPLIDLVCRGVQSGEETARVFYGPEARGWVMHMMTNVWGFTAPGEDPSWGATNTGGAWLCAHLWEHYLYNPTDTAYLQRIYPVMKGAADFFLSTMMETPEGYLVTAPSSSPENQFYFCSGSTRTPVSVCMGPTMDNQILRELFGNVARAAEIQDIDHEYAQQLRLAIDRLPANRIGSDGRLMEWLEEYEEVDPHHRHVSHLYGLHPGNEISLTYTPELAEACRLSLDTRGDGGTGWSRAWKINFWARLGDGDRAYALLKALLVPAYTEENPNHQSGTFPNLFCSHPPFQMDGNWGGTSGISEMLLQSQDGFVNLLPALPRQWSSGEFRGLKVRGGQEIDLKWVDGVPVLVTARGEGADRLDIRFRGERVSYTVAD